MISVNDLRQSIKQTRQRLSSDFLEQSSRAIATKIFDLPFYEAINCFATYRATKNEANPDDILTQAWQQQKKAFLPVLNDQLLVFKSFSADTHFMINRYGIEEPITTEAAINLEKLDCIFIPLVAFDDVGNRLGLGKGYYDKTLADLKNKAIDQKPILVGIAYELQHVKQLPAQSWDVPMDYVITERHLYSFKKDKS